MSELFKCRPVGCCVENPDKCQAACDLVASEHNAKIALKRKNELLRSALDTLRFTSIRLEDHNISRQECDGMADRIEAEFKL